MNNVKINKIQKFLNLKKGIYDNLNNSLSIFRSNSKNIR
jgi:hypothetical protein